MLYLLGLICILTIIILLALSIKHIVLKKEYNGIHNKYAKEMTKIIEEMAKVQKMYEDERKMKNVLLDELYRIETEEYAKS